MTEERAAVRPYDIYIIGTGIKWIEHITLESDRILGQCNEILYVEKAPGIESYFNTKASIVTDLTKLYGEDKHRELTYREMAAKVIHSALQRGPVAFAVYGHPTIYAYPPFLVSEMAHLLGLRVKVLPGISAMDCLFSDLMIDPSVNGLQMYEATDLLLRRHTLSPEAAAIIWQVGSIGTALYSTTLSAPERFHAFRDYLLGYYPADHPVYAYFANPHPMLRAEIHEMKVSEVPEFSEVLHAAVTLYLPPVNVKRDVDPDMIAHLTDPGYLRTVTRPIS